MLLQKKIHCLNENAIEIFLIFTVGCCRSRNPVFVICSNFRLLLGVIWTDLSSQQHYRQLSINYTSVLVWWEIRQNFATDLFFALLYTVGGGGCAGVLPHIFIHGNCSKVFISSRRSFSVLFLSSLMFGTNTILHSNSISSSSANWLAFSQISDFLLTLGQESTKVWALTLMKNYHHAMEYHSNLCHLPSIVHRHVYR